MSWVLEFTSDAFNFKLYLQNKGNAVFLSTDALQFHTKERALEFRNQNMKEVPLLEGFIPVEL
jgi:hypothetical protein